MMAYLSIMHDVFWAWSSVSEMFSESFACSLRKGFEGGSGEVVSMNFTSSMKFF